MSDASHSFFSSIKGSIKGKISRSASSSSQKSTRSARQTRGVNTNPFTPVPVPNCAGKPKIANTLREQNSLQQAQLLMNLPLPQ